MFFKSRTEALKTAAKGICLASIPGVNWGVAMAAGVANDAGKFDNFETSLQTTVFYSAKYWLPAVILLVPSLIFLAVNFIVESISSLFEQKELPAAPTVP